MKFLYNIFVSLLIFGMKIGAAFNYKLKRGLAGRRQSCSIVKSIFSREDKVIWMHAASLGEYEQGIPVLQKLKAEFPNHKILVTFFSPSGYENVVKKNHPADAVCYLPFDTNRWIREFSTNFTTEIFFTVKYDYWYNLLEHLKNSGAKTFVISALFYEKQVFFQPFGGWFSAQLKRNIDWFFHQTPNSYALARSIGIQNSSISGDTRFDRVKDIAAQDNFVEGISEFKVNHKLIVFGSSWETEEEIARIVSKKIGEAKILIAPHDLKRVDALLRFFPQAAKYSELENNREKVINSKILIVDSIGLLSKLYSYADVAVVGGGFHSAGLHNILEAATFGIPVLYGDRYQKNPEADDLIEKSGGKSFLDENYAADFLIMLLNDESLRHEMGENSREFVHSQPKSSEIILRKIKMLASN